MKLKLKSKAFMAINWDHVGWGSHLWHKPWHQNRKSRAKASLDRMLSKRIRLAEKRFFDKIIQDEVNPAEPILRGIERALQQSEERDRHEDYLDDLMDFLDLFPEAEMGGLHEREEIVELENCSVGNVIPK